MGNALHKIIHDTPESDEKIRLLVQEVNRLKEKNTHLETTNKFLIKTVSNITTSPDLAIEFVKGQGLDWMEDGFEELQIRKFQAFLKKKQNAGELINYDLKLSKQ